MPIWRPQSVDQAPELRLARWAVFEVPLFSAPQACTRHLVGWWVDGGEARVSSPVREFDQARGQFTTRTGRVYTLTGDPGLCPDGQYVWARWKALWHIGVERDMTTQVSLALMTGHGEAPGSSRHVSDIQEPVAGPPPPPPQVPYASDVALLGVSVCRGHRRLDVSDADACKPAVQDVLATAAALSARKCEVCGADATVEAHGRARARCAQHAGWNAGE